jgi:hypothetical protein
VIGRLGRAARRLVGHPVVVAGLVSALLWYALSMVGVHRLPGRYHSLGFDIGLLLFCLSLLRLIRRITRMSVPEELRSLSPHQWAGFGCLLVLNLILVNVVAPYLRLLSQARLGSPVFQAVLLLAGQLSSGLLFGLFIGGSLVFVAVLAFRLWDRLTGAGPLRRVSLAADRVVTTAFALYCVYAILLVYNGGLGAPVAREHETEVVAAWELDGPFGARWLWAVDVRSWRTPGGVESVLFFPMVDELQPGRVPPGHPVRVYVRAGFFGIPRIERLRHEPERQLAGLLDSAPSAGHARRRHTERLVAAGRWTDAVEQVRAHLRHYPADTAFPADIATRLRHAGRTEDALAVQELVVQARAAKAEREARARAAAEPDAGPPAADGLALAREWLALTGLDRRLEQVAREVESDLEFRRWEVRGPERLETVVRAFAPATLIHAAAAGVAARLHDAPAEPAVSWLRSPLGRRVTECAGPVREGDRYEGWFEFLTTLPETVPPSARLALVQRLVRAGGVAVQNTEVEIAVERIVDETVAAARRDRTTLGQRRRSLEAATFEQVAAVLFTCRSLDDAELEDAVGFREGPAGRWTTEVYRDALLAAIRAAEAGSAPADRAR